MNKTKNLLLLSIPLLTVNLWSYDNFKNYDLDNTEKTIYFGGWSKHSENKDFKKEYKKTTGEDFSYNENHNGIGLQYSIPHKTKNTFISLDFFYMKDSFKNDSYQLSLGYKYRYDIDKYIDFIDFGIGFSVFSRSILDVSSKISAKYNIKDNKIVLNSKGEKSIIYTNVNTISYERGLVAAPLPYITFNLNNKIVLDAIFMVYPMEYQESGEMIDSYNFKNHSSYETLLFLRMGYKF